MTNADDESEIACDTYLAVSSADVEFSVLCVKVLPVSDGASLKVKGFKLVNQVI